MKVVLRQDCENVGKMGDIKDVASGFFRNYLEPRDLAYPAEPKYLKVFETEKKAQLAKEKKAIAKAEEDKAKLEKLSLSVKVKAGAEDKIFGSVTTGDVAEALAAAGFTTDRKNVLIEEEIKALGSYTVSVKVYKDVLAKVKLLVEKGAA